MSKKLRLVSLKGEDIGERVDGCSMVEMAEGCYSK